MMRRLYRRWRPPIGWWRLRGRAKLSLAGQAIVFAGIAGTPNEWWALAARRRSWEQPVLEAFAAAVPRGGVVFDVGAWIGAYSLLAAKLVGPDGRVFAFEPDPVARAQLERNVALNGAANVTIVPLALTASEGTAWLSGGHSEAKLGPTGEHEVATVSLSAFIADVGARPDVMKIDIEGGELQLDPADLLTVETLFIEIHEPAFAAARVDSQAFLAAVTGSRGLRRLEGSASNYNVVVTGPRSLGPPERTPAPGV